jgi:MarR-like DNA-binding transcriptional regulator SgrR of sgrS sRNA
VFYKRKLIVAVLVSCFHGSFCLGLDMKDTILGSLNGAPEILDPAEIVDSAQWHTLVNLGENLVAHDSSGRLIGDFALSWTVTLDHMNFSFKLAKGRKDSNGNELDSSDWRATFVHLLRSGGSTHSFVAEFLDEQGIETPSPYELVIHLKKPYQTFIQRLTTPEFILIPKTSISKNNVVDLHNSSGAYKLESFNRVQKSCALKVNKNFYKYNQEQIENVTLLQLPEKNLTVFDNLAKDRWQFSLLRGLPTDPAAKTLDKLVDERSIFRTTTEPSSVAFVLFFDTKRLKSKKERLNLAKLIGENAEVDMSTKYASATHQIYPHGFVGALPPTREKQIIEMIKKGADAKSWPKRLVGYGTISARNSGAINWVEKLFRDKGISVESHPIDFTNYNRRQKEIDHDFFVSMTGLNSKDPAGTLLTMLSPKSGVIPDEDGTLNALLQKAVQMDFAERAGILHQISENLLLSGRMVPFVHFGVSILSSKTIVALPPSKFDDELKLADIRWRK